MAIVINAYQQLINYLAEKATPEELLAFNLSDDEQERARELLEKNAQNMLTPEEEHELEQMVYFDRLVSRLKARALAQ
ncbi:MAG TPA: hypothetical protein PLZ51_03825 [Aggregatilineales bacterium]|nr:hypothetical protein [Aggregatilineales bacterium]